MSNARTKLAIPTNPLVRLRVQRTTNPIAEPLKTPVLRSRQHALQVAKRLSAPTLRIVRTRCSKMDSWSFPPRNLGFRTKGRQVRPFSNPDRPLGIRRAYRITARSCSRNSHGFAKPGFSDRDTGFVVSFGHYHQWCYQAPWSSHQRGEYRDRK